MLNALSMLTKRPSDKKIKTLKILFASLCIIASILVVNIQNLSPESSFLWIPLDEQAKMLFSYAVLGFGFIPLVFGGLDINLLSRGYTRILQTIFGVWLILLSGAFVDTPNLTADILYFLLGLIAIFAGISGKFITKKGLRTGQKITKIRV